MDPARPAPNGAVLVRIANIASSRLRHAAMRSGPVGGNREAEQRDERTKVGHWVLDHDELPPSAESNLSSQG